MAEVLTATEIKHAILDEVLRLTPDQVLERVIDGAGGSCEVCEPIVAKAKTLAQFTEIGRISFADASARLYEFNAEVCTHVGDAALTGVETPGLIYA